MLNESGVSEDIKAGIVKLGGFQKEGIDKHYDDTAEDYERLMVMMGHPDPEQCGDMVAKLLGEDIRSALALDMGCGTGLVGTEMMKRGLRQVIGIDASQGMIEKAKEKGTYSDFICQFLGRPKEFPKELCDRFDVVTAAAILAENHLGCEVFDEMVMALKKGGYAVFTTRDMYLTKYGYHDYLSKMVADGIWEQVDAGTFKKYHNI